MNDDNDQADASLESDVVDERGRTWRTCLDCTERFFISKVAGAVFVDRGLPLPTRCWSCRDRRRLAREISQYEVSG